MKKRALLFSGQGAQTLGMGADLYERSPSVRALYELADQHLGYSLSEISFRGPEEKLTDTAVCQPALYVHGFALFTLLREQLPEFQFTAAAGLSLGEYTAHAVTGTFDFATGLDLVGKRARLMAQACATTRGGMIALIGASKEQAIAIANASGLDTANFNCPGQIVLSGPLELIPEAVKIASANGVKRAIQLKVAGAYHSRLMESAELGMAPHLEAAHIHRPAVPVIANFNADFVASDEGVRSTLRQQITGSVRWEQSLRTLIAVGVQEFIELGPGSVIAGHVARIEPGFPCYSIATAADLDKNLSALSA